MERDYPHELAVQLDLLEEASSKRLRVDRVREAVHNIFVLNEESGSALNVVDEERKSGKLLLMDVERAISAVPVDNGEVLEACRKAVSHFVKYLDLPEAAEVYHEAFVSSQGLEGWNEEEIFLDSEDKCNSILVIADLEDVPTELITRLMMNLDTMHRAIGGAGLYVRSIETGSTVAPEGAFV
jgi:hypothetical protein